MTTTSTRRKEENIRLPPEVSRVLHVRNVPFRVTSEEMYEIFSNLNNMISGIRHIRIGCNKDTKGTALVVYDDIRDAKKAVDNLNGFNIANRYLILTYYHPAKMTKKIELSKKEEELAKLQEKYGVSTKR